MHITDFEFTGGVTNPSEKGWKLIQSIEVDTSGLDEGDILSTDQVSDANEEKRGVNKVAQSITGLEYVTSISAAEWDLIADYNAKTYPISHKNVGIPRKCAGVHRGRGVPTDRQLKLAKEIRDAAYRDGFEFIQ